MQREVAKRIHMMLAEINALVQRSIADQAKPEGNDSREVLAAARGIVLRLYDLEPAKVTGFVAGMSQFYDRSALKEALRGLTDTGCVVRSVQWSSEAGAAVSTLRLSQATREAVASVVYTGSIANRDNAIERHIRKAFKRI